MSLADAQHYLAVPAPTGPRGLGYMSAVVGLAIPKDAPNRRGGGGADRLADQAETAGAASASLSFSPVIRGVALSGALSAESRVASLYQSDRGGVESVPPAGLGGGADDFTSVYQDTFARIVLRGEDVPTVLNEEAGRLQTLVNDAGARSWAPDRPGRGPCQIG